jgi:threonine dehydrogenase-like Zn-dependent dehydrogenase
MKAIVLSPGTTNLRLADVALPRVATAQDVRVRVLQVGICGTDREEASGGRAQAPQKAAELVIGHEMLGKVTETGSAVRAVKPGDLAVFTVRRGCGECAPCRMNRSDMCLTGRYRERGIWGMDGYQAEQVVDAEQYVVRVPDALVDIGVLTEPLSVAEKAIDEAGRIQMSRLPTAAAPDWLRGRRCLVAGLGPIGLLAAMVLTLRGAEVYGIDIVDADSPRPGWLKHIGGTYVDARQVPPDKVDGAIGDMELVLEATGVPALEFNLLDTLGVNGVYVLTGIPGGSRPLQVQGAELIRRLVLDNQVMVGSVNASQEHFRLAVDDLLRAQAQWGDHLGRLISQRRPFAEFHDALTRHDEDEIKVVLQWARP